MKIAYQANNIIEAHIIAGMLQSFGIASFVSGHYLQGAIGDLAPTGFANVMVNDDDTAAAEALVRQYEESEITLAETSEFSTDHKLA
jgi:hypothetical protein